MRLTISVILRFLVPLGWLFIDLCNAFPKAMDYTVQAIYRAKNFSSGDFSKSQTYIEGRGFSYIIAGYDTGSDEEDTLPRMEILACDWGYASRGWTYFDTRGYISAPDLAVGDDFGAWVLHDPASFTLLVSAPNQMNGKGAIYYYNGTKKDWTLMQKLVVFDAMAGDMVGIKVAIYGDRILAGSPGAEDLSQQDPTKVVEKYKVGNGAGAG